MEVDQEGGARWADSNERPPYLPPPDTAATDEDRMPAGLRSLGEVRASPFLAMAFPHDETSQLGGFATWVQDADFPPCPKCGELMLFIGQVDTSVAAWGEGTVYAFVDAGCGTAATCYQQT